VIHLRLACGAAAIAGVALYFADYKTDAAIMASAIVIGEAMFSNDLDGYASSSKRRWRRIGLSRIWFMWEKLPHRSIFSHGPIIADTLRVLYLAAIASAIYFAYCLLTGGYQRAVVGYFKMWTDTGRWLHLNWEYCATAFTGLAISTTIHSSADWITGEADKVVDFVAGKSKKKGKRNARKQTHSIAGRKA
jgi:uncharacterized metal-binding protein